MKLIFLIILLSFSLAINLNSFLISNLRGNNKILLKHDDDDDDDDNWDWRKYIDLAEPIDQKINQCASSYVISTVDSINNIDAYKHGESKDISVQQYIDCYDSDTCDNGDISSVVKYYSGKKVCKSNNYPYKAEKKLCRESECDDIEIPKIDYYRMKQESAIYGAIFINPIPTKIYIDPLLNYTGGIYDNYNECNNVPNHYVLIIGFGEEKGKKYWILKNSFGKNWGENGYLRIARDKNMCGIGNESYLIYKQKWKDYVIAVIVIAIISVLISILCCVGCCCFCCFAGCKMNKRNNKDTVVKIQPHSQPQQIYVGIPQYQVYNPVSASRSSQDGIQLQNIQPEILQQQIQPQPIQQQQPIQSQPIQSQPIQQQPIQPIYQQIQVQPQYQYPQIIQGEAINNQIPYQYYYPYRQQSFSETEQLYPPTINEPTK